jgi:spermidine synthase
MSLWFIENLEIAVNLRAQVKIENRLHSEKSPFQKIEIFETTGLGRMLTLDDVIMCTEFDEAAYHEMIVHVPLFAHKNPEKILVIGGGDGGTVREVVKHPGVKHVDMCEIDERVVRVSQQYLPSFASELNNPKVALHFKDGIQWVKERRNEYDVILVDSSDPVGPAEVLFTDEFFGYCHASLKEDGILVNQAENFYMHRSIIKRMLGFGGSRFPISSYYFTVVPTYPGGQIGFTFFSKKYTPFENLDARTSGDLSSFQFRYWTPEIHRAAFQLPRFVRDDFGLKQY